MSFDNVIIRQIVVGPLQVNTYLVVCRQTHQAVLIDPAGDVEKLLLLIADEQARIQYILNTHGHADHVLANCEIAAAVGAPVCMHGDDDRFFADAEVRRRSEQELGLPPPAPVDIRLQDADHLAVGRMTIEVIHTPGHTPGSVCFLAHGHLFTGDTLFVGAVGRTDLTGGSLDTLLASLERRVITLPPDTIIWPGHDYGETPTSTIGREMQENPYITDFILDA